MYHEKMNHVNVKFYFIRDTIAEEKALAQKINIKKNLADMFTKLLPVHKFKQYVNLIGVRYW